MSVAWLPLGLAALDWLALRFGWNRLEPITKPAVMFGVLAWMLANGPVFGTPVAWFFAGVALSLIGDVFLLPALDRLGPALGVFLLAHVAYITGLNAVPPPLNFSTALFALVVALPAVRVYGRISAGLNAAGRQELRLPVLFYTLALSGTMFSGLSTLANPAWPPVPALLGAGGAVMLGVSDILLGWNRFVQPTPAARFAIRATYHLGQIALVGGVLRVF
ncbi:MAG TPA: lysoplasmalogenase [Anaerolineales bacterium]|nr:lysoplasmalogenase [Anaerolineales bacterium]